MSDEYDVRTSGHDESCSYWWEDDNCSCGLYERDLAYSSGYRAAVKRLTDPMSEESGMDRYKLLTDYDKGLRERIVQSIRNKHMFCYPSRDLSPFMVPPKDFTCTHLQDINIVEQEN